MSQTVSLVCLSVLQLTLYVAVKTQLFDCGCDFFVFSCHVQISFTYLLTCVLICNEFTANNLQPEL